MKHTVNRFYLSEHKMVNITLGGHLIVEATEDHPSSFGMVERVMLTEHEALRLARMIEHWDNFGGFLGWETAIPRQLCIDDDERIAVWLCYESVWGDV